MTILVSQAVKTFLSKCTIPDFADYYNHDMELQINVAQDGGDVVKSDYKGKTYLKYTDGLQEWSHIRIPKNAGTNPEDNDREMRWELEKHADGIGLTGWDWKNKISRYVGFDFDSISNHVKAGLTDAQLVSVREQAMAIPWVTVRKSTSGKGLHLYVMLGEILNGIWVGGVPTNNHHEHASLARAILGKMSAIANFDFQSTVDVCGAVLWIYHRKQRGTDGFGMVKAGIVLNEVPVNWRDHIKVVRGERRRSVPTFIEEDNQDPFEELTGTHARIQLDSGHKKVIEYIENKGGQLWWDPDRHLLVCHTADLKDAHANLTLRGIYETLATGKDHGADQNCFCFPISNGGWIVRRHTPGVHEHPVWEQDGQGWTRIYYNVDADINIAARANDASENTKGGWVFKTAEVAQAALQRLGIEPSVAPAYINRAAIVREHKDGTRLIFEIKREDTDVPMPGWILEGKNPWGWTRIFQPRTKPIKDSDVGSLPSDKLIRHIVDGACTSAGWVVKGARGDWEFNSLPEIKAALQTWGFSTKETNIIIGTNVIQGWKLVNKPFENEYPGDRTWNRDAAQLRYTPNPNSDDLKFPTWQSVLNHCGSGLDEAIKTNAWCQANCIQTGAEYLMLWISSMFKHPDEPLPFLFFWSDKQNNGKSTFHEALSLLMTRGACNAGTALTSQNDYNGELEHAILCYVEEKNVASHKQAYPRIKEWTTARMISIRPMYQQSRLMPNYTHWCMMANSRDACPIDSTDTRITAIHVPDLPYEAMIPKSILIKRLEQEAPDFLRCILDIEIPASNDRLFVPMIATDEKNTLADRNKGIVDRFIEDNCHQIYGHAIKFSDLYDRFRKYARANEEEGVDWSKIKFTRSLPIGNACGASMTYHNDKYVANLSWKLDEVGIEVVKPEPLPKFRVVDGKLVQ